MTCGKPMVRVAYMNKRERKAAVKKWRVVERAELVAGMPLAPEQLHRLLNYLDANLEACDHTTKLTQIFLHAEQLDREKVLSWLREQGRFCDCEVLANLEDIDQTLQAPQPAPRIAPRQKQDRAPRSLETVTGWNLSKLPPPWRVANLYDPSGPVRLELGKKGGCSIAIIESPLPAGEQSSDEFWAGLWYDRTELPPEGALQVTRGVPGLRDGLASTLVRAPRWSPVYCWVAPTTGSWHLEIKTESNRSAGDLPQISSLIARLVRSQV